MKIYADHLNTPRLVADAAGTTVWRWDQAEPFANNPADENPSGLGTFDLPLRLPGQYFDKETNLHQNYFREFDPGIGRFERFDPIGLRGGLNGYAYVANKPLTWVDPYGLAPAAGSGFSSRYGNWCGKNWSGGQEGRLIPPNPAAPIDSVDACCRDHDYCYSKYECPAPCVPEKVEKEGKAKCDEGIVECLDKLKGTAPRNWPQPPKRGTEAEAYFYCQKAKWWFRD